MGASDFLTITLARNVKIHYTTSWARERGIRGGGKGEKCGLVGVLSETKRNDL